MKAMIIVAMAALVAVAWAKPEAEMIQELNEVIKDAIEKQEKVSSNGLRQGLFRPSRYPRNCPADIGFESSCTVALFSNGYNCYCFVDMRMKWYDANDYCASYNMSLPSPQSMLDIAYMYGINEFHRFWTSGYYDNALGIGVFLGTNQPINPIMYGEYEAPLVRSADISQKSGDSNEPSQWRPFVYGEGNILYSAKSYRKRRFACISQST